MRRKEDWDAVQEVRRKVFPHQTRPASSSILILLKNPHFNL